MLPNLVLTLVSGVLLASALPGRAAVSATGPMEKVGVIRAPGWLENDPAREGAAELVVLMEIARLQREGARAGLVAVGDRRGLFSPGAEEALRGAVLRGIPVVKLASNGRVLRAPHGLFLDGGGLSEEEARQVLARCLAQHGGLPAASPASPELRARLEVFQRELTVAAGTRVALR